MAERATAEGQILVEIDEAEFRFDPSEVAVDDGATAGAPRVSREDPMFLLKGLRRLATPHSDPTDPRARLRKLRRELGAAGGSAVGDVAPALHNQMAELRRLTSEAGDLGAGILVEAPAEVGSLETGEIPRDLGGTSHTPGPSRHAPRPSRPSREPGEVFEPWGSRPPFPGAPTPGPGGGSAPGGDRPGSGGPEPSEDEQGPSIDIGTIAWVLLILAFILLQLVGGEQ